MPTIDERIIEALRRNQVVTEYIVFPQQNSDITNYQINLKNVPSISKEDVIVIHNGKIIPSWVESKGNVWTKLPILFKNKPIKVYALTGNPSAISVSSGANTFVKFDDFNDGSINSMWTSSGGTWTESGGVIQTSSSEQTLSVTLDSNDYIIEAKIRPDVFASDKSMGIGGAYNGLASPNNRGHVTSIMYNDVTLLNSLDIRILWGAGYLTGFTFTAGNWYNFKTALMLSGNTDIKGKAWLYGTNEPIGWLFSATLSSQTPKNAGLYSGFGSTVSFDDFRVRKYISSEPIIKKTITSRKSLLFKALFMR